MISKRVVVRGKVQNVGFRYFVSQEARRLGVKGEVWNRHDGAVELVAQHDSVEVVETLISNLQCGPGRVESVFVVDDIPEGHEFFRIGPSR